MACANPQNLDSTSVGRGSSASTSRGCSLPPATACSPGLSSSYATQIHNILRYGYRQIGEAPIVLGETGCPFDLNDKAAFRTKDFSWQERMLDGICSAIGDSGLSNFK